MAMYAIHKAGGDRIAVIPGTSIKVHDPPGGGNAVCFAVLENDTVTAIVPLQWSIVRLHTDPNTGE